MLGELRWIFWGIESEDGDKKGVGIVVSYLRIDEVFNLLVRKG